MIISAKRKLTVSDLDVGDFLTVLKYRKFNVWEYRKMQWRKHDVIWGIIRANQVVSDFLEGV